MRNFSWQYFTMTGDVDAYLLYKQITDPNVEDSADEEDSEDESVVQ
ncbi:YqzL family protein [Paenibacillus xerothermodurans]|uniref:YqzL family protein n=1 Tax=Paenibacillus xerothermodurans TaxID=1977292 RepID=A0A2W1NHS2_PAEXE|nr:YqzL family protein [Paenibacillus xerothermodurans]PZE22691.1 YqzL family protein [Paenibacillus xerothermodurans]